MKNFLTLKYHLTPILLPTIYWLSTLVVLLSGNYLIKTGGTFIGMIVVLVGCGIVRLFFEILQKLYSSLCKYELCKYEPHV